jgi:hypothetical protein
MMHMGDEFSLRDPEAARNYRSKEISADEFLKKFTNNENKEKQNETEETI